MTSLTWSHHTQVRELKLVPCCRHVQHIKVAPHVGAWICQIVSILMNGHAFSSVVLLLCGLVYAKIGAEEAKEERA